MKNKNSIGYRTLKKARLLTLYGALTTILIISIYHNFFSEKINKIDFFGIFLTSYCLVFIFVANRSIKINLLISNIEEVKKIKNPHKIIEILDKFKKPEMQKIKKKLNSIYHESSFVFGICISFVLSIFTYFIGN